MDSSYPTTERIRSLFEELFPLCRSLTGDPNRETLRRLAEETPLTLSEVPSGTTVYDWEVPPEWHIREAWIKDSDGNTIVDFADSNLHVVNYSVPVHEELSFEELRPQLHTLPSMPEAIPYRTTYYDRTWGFCLSAETLDEMDESDTYEVYIDSSLDPEGSLTYAEATIEGDSDREYLLSTYCCHPSLANDNLSGPILATLLFERLGQADPYHSYRLVIAPETIGILSYLHENEAAMTAVDGGYVVTTVAGPGQFGYKESFHGDHEVDTAARLALADDEFIEYPFRPTGSDERQYSSPGFRIPTGTITKDKYYEYDQYHTSADDLEFVSAAALKQSFERYWDAITYLEMNRTYQRVHPYGEFKLDAHDLYPSTGGGQRQPAAEDDDSVLAAVDASASNDEILSAIEWLMFGCDGTRSLFELAERSGLAVETLFTAAQEMETKELLSVCRHD